MSDITPDALRALANAGDYNTAPQLRAAADRIEELMLHLDASRQEARLMRAAYETATRSDVHQRIEAQDEAWAAWLVEQGYGYDWIATPLPPVAVRRKVELLYAERDGCSVDDVEWAMVQEFGDAWLTRQEAEG